MYRSICIFLFAILLRLPVLSQDATKALVGMNNPKAGSLPKLPHSIDLLQKMHGTDSQFVIRRVSHYGITASTSEPLSISFSSPVDTTSIRELMFISGGGGKEPIGTAAEWVKGKWKAIEGGKTLVFTPLKSFTSGMFFSVTIPETFRSVSGVPFKNGKDVVTFITNNGQSYGRKEIRIETIKMVDDNRIPLVMSMPTSPGKHPVLIFVHGGAWKGGTQNESFASLPGGYFTEYVTGKLGVAVVAVAYRCVGSNGTFSKAKTDISDAVSYVKAHADEYSFDLDRLGICGESAGSPLASLIAQEDTSIQYFIGWNGLYDFTDNPDSKFGGGNSFGQQLPSARANSAIFQIRMNGPETLLLHGNQDKTINVLQSVRFNAAVNAAGGHSSLLIYDGQPHWTFYAPGGPYEISTLFYVGRFLKRTLKLK